MESGKTDIEKALDAAARCVNTVKAGEDEDLCEECGYREGYGGFCMTQLVRDLTAIIAELREEIARLRTCGTCVHREVCHVVYMREESGSKVNTPCQHWRSE